MASETVEQQVVVVEEENVEVTENVEVEVAAAANVEVQIVKRSGVFTGMLYHLSRFWPISIMIRAYRGVWYMFGFRPKDTPEVSTVVSTPARPSRPGLKRLRRVTRIIMAVLPRRMQSALGYPVPTSVGCSLSPEMRISATKPCGKGNKRKQDELDEDEEDDEEVEQHTWVEALAHELATDEGSDEDPDYQPSAVESEEEESSHESDLEEVLEVNQQGSVIIEEVAVPPVDST